MNNLRTHKLLLLSWVTINCSAFGLLITCFNWLFGLLSLFLLIIGMIRTFSVMVVVGWWRLTKEPLYSAIGDVCRKQNAEQFVLVDQRGSKSPVLAIVRANKIEQNWPTEFGPAIWLCGAMSNDARHELRSARSFLRKQRHLATDWKLVALDGQAWRVQHGARPGSMTRRPIVSIV